MRHPSGRKTDDDLSRLTTSSSSSRDPSTHRSYRVDSQLDPAAPAFTSTYLPQVIDPIEWQQLSRKRKERQDSTSSITQDRKLVRSNSEEYIPSVDYEIIRRVSSHEDISNPLDESLNSLLESQPFESSSRADVDECSFKSSNNEVQEILREANRRAETSPARSRPFDFAQKYGPHRDDSDGRNCRRDYGDAESERRRSERFYMTRAAHPGRKSTAASKRSPSLANKHPRPDRRGFVSHSSTPDQKENEPRDEVDDMSSSSSDRQQHDARQYQQPSSTTSALSMRRSPKGRIADDPHPWHSFQCDEVPVVCQRFADNTFDHVNNSMGSHAKVRNASVMKSMSAANFTKAENLKTCEIMKGVPPSLFSSPDEKIKQINKRLTTLKKRVIIFEETFERENGYRPSHSVKLGDHYMRNAVAEIHKLRKEKQAIKTDPMASMGYKTTQTGGNKVAKMRDTLLDIEKVNSKKKNYSN